MCLPFGTFLDSEPCMPPTLTKRQVGRVESSRLVRSSQPFKHIIEHLLNAMLPHPRQKNDIAKDHI